MERAIIYINERFLHNFLKSYLSCDNKNFEQNRVSFFFFKQWLYLKQSIVHLFIQVVKKKNIHKCRVSECNQRGEDSQVCNKCC